MKHAILLFFFSFVFCLRAEPARPIQVMEGEVKSVVITDHKIVFVMSGTMRLAMLSADRSHFETPLVVLDDVPITYVRELDDQFGWRENVKTMREATGKKLKLNCHRPSFTYEGDRITSLSIPVLWIANP